MIRRRTEKLSVSFKDGLAEGWVFGVGDFFRDQLDIKYTQFVDRDASKELRKARQQGEDGKLSTVYRMAWSQGDPPMLCFDVGHVFYDPPETRHMVWGEALKLLRRSVQVTEATPDSEVEASGWVKFDVRHYDGGEHIQTEKHTASQAEFLNFLRTGRLSATKSP